MSGYDYDRPFIDQASLALYVARDRAAARYGKAVKAAQLSNIEYKERFHRLKRHHRMKPPPSCGRIFMGYLVLRNLGKLSQYETWMPDHVFDELYRIAVEPPQ
jgi:hypothetical protein